MTVSRDTAPEPGRTGQAETRAAALTDAGQYREPVLFQTVNSI